LSAANVTSWLVDTGFSSGVTDLDQLAGLCVGRVHEIVRLESVAEEAALAAGDYAAAFEAILHERTKTAVATKSILAYRGGFAGDLSEHTSAEVADAASRWRDSGGTRLTDRVLLRFGLHQELRVGKPLQFHVGFGDRDCDLHTTNPMYLLGFLRVSGQTPVMNVAALLPVRAGGRLPRTGGSTTSISTAGLPSTSSGPGRRTSSAGCWRWRRSARSSIRPMRSALQNCTISEHGWRNGMGKVLQGFVDADKWSEADAIRVVDLIANGNARRVYRLG
jgi:uncharacterized protein